MQIEKVGSTIGQLLEKNEFLRMLAGVSDYMIYGYTALLVIAQFIPLGGFVNALLHNLFFVLLILGFAAKKYLGLIVLAAGRAFVCIYGLCHTIYLSFFLSSENYLSSSYYLPAVDLTRLRSDALWENLFGVVIFGLLIWLFSALYKKNQQRQKEAPFVPNVPTVPGSPEAFEPPLPHQETPQPEEALQNDYEKYAPPQGMQYQYGSEELFKPPVDQDQPPVDPQKVPIDLHKSSENHP